MPILWEACDSTEKNLFRQSIIECLIWIVKGMGTDIKDWYQFLIPAIAYCIDNKAGDDRLFVCILFFFHFFFIFEILSKLKGT